MGRAGASCFLSVVLVDAAIGRCSCGGVVARPEDAGDVLACTPSP